MRFHSTIIPLILLVSITVSSASRHGQRHPDPNQPHQQEAVFAMSKSLNAHPTSIPAKLTTGTAVFKQPLTLHSTSPMTGFLRNGYCEVPAADMGNHAVAAEVTEEFLDFTARQGNDLRSIGGMRAGCRWCLCAVRWLEAFEARARDPAGDKIVPKVFLHATNEKALRVVDLADLKAFAADNPE